MTYNILGDADAKSRMKMFETIRRENPDVVCCMEYNHIKDNNLFKQQIGDLYPYIVSNRDSESWSSGELLLSKHPVTLKQNVLMPYGVHGTFDFLFAELSINGKKVNFVNVHLITVGHHVEDVARSIHSLRRNASNTFNKKINLASRFEKNRDIMKYNEAKSMLDYIKLFEDPTIICGDLNDTPNSRVYYLFSPRYVNAFSAAGWGFGDTFGELWIMKKLFVLLHRNERVIPFLFAFARDIMRIDHIFVSKDIEIIDSHAVKKAAGSDHKPVTAILRLK